MEKDRIDKLLQKSMTLKNFCEEQGFKISDSYNNNIFSLNEEDNSIIREMVVEIKVK